MSSHSGIQNAGLLTNIFGRFPTFHDAEVLRIILDRGDGNRASSLETAVYLFEMTSDVDEGGKYVVKNEVKAILQFCGIAHLEIDKFNHQNVLSELLIERLVDSDDNQSAFEVTFRGIFGMHASFRCETASVVSVEPYES